MNEVIQNGTRLCKLKRVRLLDLVAIRQLLSMKMKKRPPRTGNFAVSAPPTHDVIVRSAETLFLEVLAFCLPFAAAFHSFDRTSRVERRCKLVEEAGD